MRPRGVDSFGAYVDAGHRETQARHRFGDKAAAAADVEQGEPGEWPQRGGIASEVGYQLLTDKAQSGWIDAVQCPETSLGIPPALGLCCEAADFPGIDSAAGHAQLPILIARHNRPNGTGSPKELWERAVSSAIWVGLAADQPCTDLPLTDTLSEDESHRSKIRRHLARRCRSHQECCPAGQTRSRCRERGGRRRLGDGRGDQPARRLDATVKPCA